MIVFILILYFGINIFFAGVYYAENSFRSYLHRIIATAVLMLFFIPLTFIANLIDIAKDLYWKFMNFTMIGVYIYYKKGKYKNLNEWQIERVKKELSLAKYGFQKSILQKILNQNQSL